MKQRDKKGIPCSPGGWNWLFMREPENVPELGSTDGPTITIRFEPTKRMPSPLDNSAQSVSDVEPPTTAK